VSEITKAYFRLVKIVSQQQSDFQCLGEGGMGGMQLAIDLHPESFF
jgi:hypothetical protein